MFVLHGRGHWPQADAAGLALGLAPNVELLHQVGARLDFVSARVGNYQFSDEWAMLWDQLWVR